MTVSERIKIIIPPLLLSLVIYHLAALLVITAFFAVIYPLPLLLSARKHGRDFYVLSTAVFMGITALLRLVVIGSGELVGISFIAYELIYLGLVFGLLYWFEYGGVRYFWSERVLVSLVPVLLLTSALSIFLMTSPDFTAPLKEILAEITGSINGMLPQDSTFAQSGANDAVWIYFRRIFLSVFGAGLFLITGLNLLISYRIRNKNFDVLKKTMLPEWSVWLLFVPLTIVLIAQLMQKSIPDSLLVQWISPLITNVVIITGLLFGLQGIRILSVILRHFNVAPSVKRLIFLILVLFAFIPAVGKFLIFILPLAGISELWIDYPKILNKELNQ